jgi:pimeloyl-ACP methyl ester carboxylesterase
VPTLLVWATADVLSPLTVARRLAELIPDAALATIASDDHMFAAVHAAEVAELVRAHVDRDRPSREA